MCTYEQIRFGLAALDRLIQWDLDNIPQDDSVRDHFISGLLGETDMTESMYRIRYQELNHLLHGQFQQLYTDLRYSLLDTPGGRKIALMLIEYPRETLGLRFDTRLIPMYNHITQKLMGEITSSDQWMPDDPGAMLDQVLATPRSDSDLLVFKLMM